jgi:MYXO-CTERM domain-containing protein
MMRRSKYPSQKETANVRVYKKYIAPIALLIAGTTIWMLPGSATAFQQTMTCNPTGAYACQRGETPLPVLWPGAQARFVINEAGTAHSDAPPGLSEQLEEAVIWSFQQWNQVECPSAAQVDRCSDMLLIYEGTTRASVAEFNQRNMSANENLVVWRDENWNQVSGPLTFALTSVTFNPTTGRIVDADLEINAELYPLNVIDPVEPNRADLRNTLVHEVGHFIGLDHSRVPEATMYASAELGETDKRSLEADDIAGVCESYPPTFEPARDCGNSYVVPNPDLNPNGVDGFDDRDSEDDDSGIGFACSVGSAARPSVPAWLLGLCAFLGAARIRRRRAR